MVCLLLAAVTICIYSSEHWLVFFRMLDGVGFQGSALMMKSNLFEKVIDTYIQAEGLLWGLTPNVPGAPILANCNFLISDIGFYLYNSKYA